MNEDQQSSSLTTRTVLAYCGVVPDEVQGFLDLGDIFDSCTTVTLTLCLSSNTHSSVSLFLIPLAMSCRTLNVLSSLICSVGGAGDRVGGGDCWDDQVSHIQSLYLRYWAAFKITEHFACTHPEHLVH